MCCCPSPNVNGTPGYKWNPGDVPRVRPIDAPAAPEGATILYDEPGRCGGQDSHSFHYRVIGARVGLSFPSLLVRHGGGDETIRLSNGRQVLRALALLDSDGRYWLLNALYHAQADARRDGRDRANATWKRAAAEGRIKVRKVRNGGGAVRVELVGA